MGGMATGLPPNLVDQIIEAERIPVKTQEENRAKVQSKLKLVEDLESKVGGIQKTIGELVNTKGFSNYKLISSDPNVIAGTSDPDNPMTGTWNVEVLQLPQKPSAVSNGFPDKNRTELGVGYLKFETPDGVKDVYINGNNTTLEGVVRSINQANIGVQATIVNDRTDKDNPFKLLISGLATGDEKQVRFPTVYLLDGDQDMYFENSRPAQNGRIKVDGFEFEVSDRTAKDILPGVTLELKHAAPGQEVTISVKEDTEAIVGKIEEFVKSTNEVLQFIQAQNKLDQKSDTSKSLGGDSLLRSIESRIRNLIQQPQYGVRSSIKRMSELGINFQRTGLLQLERKKFDNVLNNSPKDVGAFLAGDGFSVGFIPSLKREIDTLMNQSYGPLSNRKRGLQQKVENINKTIENKERNLAKREESLRRQFSNLETTVSKLQSQGAAISGALNAQPKAQQG
jgi:flagellar hook-associated protein 2